MIYSVHLVWILAPKSFFRKDHVKLLKSNLFQVIFCIGLKGGHFGGHFEFTLHPFLLCFHTNNEFLIEIIPLYWLYVKYWVYVIIR